MSLPPPAVLHGRRIGLSVSPSPDLRRLGLSDDAVDDVLEGLVAGVLDVGGTLAYGGHPGPGGQADVILSAVRRHGARPRPALRIYLAWSEHRRLGAERLAETLSSAADAQVLCLDPDGRVIPDPLDVHATVPPDAVPDGELTRRGLTAMRLTMAEETDGRVLIGGRRTGYAGAMPGLAEEALSTLRAGTALYLAAGLGGVTADVARALGVDACAWLPPDDGSADPGVPGGTGTDAWREALVARRTSAGRAEVRNGLTVAENHRLAATRDAREIVALVLEGITRLPPPGPAAG